MAQSHYPPNWIERLSANLNVHGWLDDAIPHEVIRFFTGWGRAEGGFATWNPLNTTLHVRGGSTAWQGTDYNDAGVCNYSKPVYGVMATAATLLNGYYNLLVGALQGALESGLTAEEIVQAHRDEIRTWGTNPDTILNVLKEIP